MPISAMCIRYLSDVRRAAEALGETSVCARRTRSTSGAHQQRGEPADSDDGRRRRFEVGSLAYFVGIFAAALSDSGYINIPPFEAAIKASVARDPDGTPTGSFYYDVPGADHDAATVDRISPAGSSGNGNGVELWLYRYLPADAKAVIEAANTKLPVAVRLKFGMPV